MATECEFLINASKIRLFSPNINTKSMKKDGHRTRGNDAMRIFNMEQTIRRGNLDQN
ncbi:unnamed protein product [Hymenolepis diminuta]|uniref:Uncharacterized protein n=1 Tax=Hymenolepis diminuta TaxID=6216 RepID=A0A564YPY1_HYMDI|nr:unnamed protein product [Hymenolepis diminuta]